MIFSGLFSAGKNTPAATADGSIPQRQPTDRSRSDSRRIDPAATADGSIPRGASVGAGEPAPAEAHEDEGRQRVGEARVEVVDVRQTDREALAEQIAEADDDRDEEALAEAARSQRAERE